MRQPSQPMIDALVTKMAIPPRDRLAWIEQMWKEVPDLAPLRLTVGAEEKATEGGCRRLRADAS